MYRIIWTSDIHLDVVESTSALRMFYTSIQTSGAHILLIAGDISHGRKIVRHLTELERNTSLPVYFVLGNHDYDFYSIASVRSKVQSLTQQSSSLHWLSDCGMVPLTESTVLLGHDGWYDANFNYWSTSVHMSDFDLIRDFQTKGLLERYHLIQALAHEALSFLDYSLSHALVRYSHILLVTHVPPFKEASKNWGVIKNDDFLPFFCCTILGDFLLSLMKKYSDKRMAVFCGHTHESARF
ncbi:MAG: metallophosphoesterase [SAR324 cluster bacterium]|nr:metallophosphoesterase [SAR324 cluster bacterium]